MHPFAAPNVEHDHNQPSCKRCEERSAQGLVDAVIDHLSSQQRVLAADFANAVEDNDGVVDRVTDQGQEGCHGGQVDLEVLNEEGAGQTWPQLVNVMAKGNDAQGEEQVVNQAENGRQTERPVTEAEPEVQQDRSPARQDRIK